MMCPKPTPPAPKRPRDQQTARPAKRTSRPRKTRTLMKVSPGDGLRSWVTVQLPAWAVVVVAAFILLGVFGVLSSPELAARMSVALLELSKWLRKSADP